MKTAYILDAIRTPFGNFGGSLATTRVDDLGALVIKTLMARNPNVPCKPNSTIQFDIKGHSIPIEQELKHYLCNWLLEE